MMDDLNTINAWLTEQIGRGDTLSHTEFDEAMLKIQERHGLVQGYLTQQRFTAERLEAEKTFNEDLYAWVLTLRHRIQQELIQSKKTQAGITQYHEVDQTQHPVKKKDLGV
jgi:hypothetical protein